MGKEEAPVFSEGMVAPIAGLLALLFAVMAGMTVQPALSGSLRDMMQPLIFGGGSLFFFYIRQQSLAANADSR